MPHVGCHHKSQQASSQIHHAGTMFYSSTNPPCSGGKLLTLLFHQDSSFFTCTYVRIWMETGSHSTSFLPFSLAPQKPRVECTFSPLFVRIYTYTHVLCIANKLLRGPSARPALIFRSPQGSANSLRLRLPVIPPPLPTNYVFTKMHFLLFSLCFDTPGVRTVPSPLADSLGEIGGGRFSIRREKIEVTTERHARAVAGGMQCKSERGTALVHRRRRSKDMESDTLHDA